MQRVAYWQNTTFELFSSLSFRYTTILNVVKHGKRWNISNLPIQASLNEAETTNNNSGKSSYAIYEFSTIFPYCVFFQKLHIYRLTLHLHALNNSTIVHQIKIIYICKMLRMSSSLIFCHSRPCLKCLKCCLFKFAQMPC